MLASHPRQAPSIRLWTPKSTARALRKAIARHNLRVLVYAAWTLLGVAAAWMALYLVATWLVVVASSAFEWRLTRIPRGFGILFTVAAVCALIYAWIDQWLTPNERPRDEKQLSELMSDVILAVPRMTLALGGTLAAWQRWKADDFLQAATFLHRLTTEKKLPLSSVRLDIPDASAVMRILFGLQLMQVVEMRREGQEFWIKLNALRPPAFRQTRESYADA